MEALSTTPGLAYAYPYPIQTLSAPSYGGYGYDPNNSTGVN
jgi:hypothetical protein